MTERDVWVVTYPRSGTTWTQEMVRVLPPSSLHQIWTMVNDLDFCAARRIDIDSKFFFLDMDWLGGSSNYIGACQQALGQRRLIKTHLPLHLLPR